MMRNASYPLVATASTSSSENLKKRTNLFAPVLAVLHHSRLIQSQRILQRYRHLIAEAADGELSGLKPKKGQENAGD